MINGIQETITAGTGYFDVYVRVFVPKKDLSKKVELELISEVAKKVSPVSRSYNPKGRAIDYQESGRDVNFFA